MSKSNQIQIYDRNENLVMQTHYEVEGSYLTLDEINPMFIYAFIASEDEKTIVINELLPNNKGNFVNENGEYSGYIRCTYRSKYFRNYRK